MIRHPNPVAPKAAGATELVLAPAAVPERLAAATRRRFSSELARRVPGRSQGTQRFDSWRATTHGVAPSTPFAWSPRIARRALGLGAARRVQEGTAPSPMAGVRAEIAHVLDQAARRGTGRASMATWLADLPRGARGAVLAEAATFATDVLDALDLASLGESATIGGGDPTWAVPGAPWATVRGRRDVEVALDPSTGTRALLCLRAGAIRHDAGDDLSIVALADALTHPDAPIPTRVVGVWPLVGRSMSLEVRPADLDRAMQLILSAADVARQATASSAASVEQGACLQVA
ncbi:MAG: hypothetical protein WCG96_06590 [Actinomycetes bacterium]